MAQQVFPTKGNLMALKKSNALAKMGQELMNRKRNILTREMMNLMDDVRLLRDEITKTYDQAYLALQEANITQGTISEIAKAVPIDNGIIVKYRSVMGVELPILDYKKIEVNPTYGIVNSNSKLDYAFMCFQKVKEITVTLAEVENSVYRLANAIRKSQKRANALENIVIPNFDANIAFITNALEEKEREEFTRQKVIKANKDKKNENQRV